jgi:hypothetical protein
MPLDSCRIFLVLKVQLRDITFSISSKTLRDEFIEEIWDKLSSLKKSLDQNGCKIGIAIVVKRGRKANVTNATSTT